MAQSLGSLRPGAGTFTSASISADGKSMAYVYQGTESVPDVFSSTLSKWEPKQVSEANKDFPKLAMGKTEVVRWKSKDGKEIEGLLTYPVNYKQGRQYL